MKTKEEPRQSETIQKSRHQPRNGETEHRVEQHRREEHFSYVDFVREQVHRQLAQNRFSRKFAQSICLACFAKFTSASDTPRNTPSRRNEFSFSCVEMLVRSVPATAFSICPSRRSRVVSSCARKSAKSAASGCCERLQRISCNPMRHARTSGNSSCTSTCDCGVARASTRSCIR